jgi:hypothetical protein
LVERRPEKAGVASSILAPGTIRSRHCILAKEIYFQREQDSSARNTAKFA